MSAVRVLNSQGFMPAQEAATRRTRSGPGFRSISAAQEMQRRYPIETNPSLPLAPRVRHILPFLDAANGEKPYSDVHPLPRLSAEEYSHTRPINKPEIISTAHDSAWPGPNSHFFDYVELGEDLNVGHTANANVTMESEQSHRFYDELSACVIQDDTVAFFKANGFAWAHDPKLATHAQMFLLSLPLRTVQSSGKLPLVLAEDFAAEDVLREVKEALKREQATSEWP